jgi:hypothetical protein
MNEQWRPVSGFTDADNLLLTNSRQEHRLRFHPTQPSTTGEGNSHAVLTAEDVLTIRGQRGRKIQDALAREYGVGQRTISKIQLRVTWRHLP